MAVKKKKPVWFVYLLECTNGRLYTGITTDLAARFAKHLSGKGAMFTRLNKPARLIAAKSCKDRSVASKLEWAVKQLKVADKRALAATWKAIKELPAPALSSKVKTSPVRESKMKKRSILLILATLFVAPQVRAQSSDSKFPLFDTVAAAQHHCPFDVVVWLNTKADTYSMDGPQPGAAKDSGAYMCQRDADQMDYQGRDAECPLIPAR